MSDKKTFFDSLNKELRQSKRQFLFYKFFHSLLLLVNILLGSITTYLAAVNYTDAKMVAMLAGATTIAGMLEKTFGFGKKKGGYRNAKTRFQNLEIDVNRLGGNDVPDEFWDRLKEIRSLKTELTTGV